MSSWLAGKVSGLVKKDAPRFASTAPTTRTADELAAELTLHARGLSSPEGAIEMLSRWIEQLKSSSGRYQLRAEHLTFRLVLLRSQAFETVVETCLKVPSLRTALLSPAEAESASLSKGLLAVAEWVLVPDAVKLWATLLEALAGDEDDGSPAEQRRKWQAWSRHMLTSLKRQWQTEGLVGMTTQLDRQLEDLASKSAVDEDASDLWQHGSDGQGQQLSKRGIRAVLARGRLRQLTAESGMRRQRTELLCDACEQLEIMEGSIMASMPNLERLLAEANAAVGTLDSGKEELGAEREVLGKDLSELGSTLQKQLSGVLAVQEGFTAKRVALCEEREALKQRLHEIEEQLSQLDEEASRCAAQVQQLRGQFDGMAKHFDEKTKGIVHAQQRVYNRKLRAESFRECAQVAVDLAQEYSKRREAEHTAALQRRRGELRRSCAAYVQTERQRLNTATECLDASSEVGCAIPEAPAQEAEISEETAKVMAVAQSAWRAAQEVLQRAVPLAEKTSPLKDDTLVVATPPAAPGPQPDMGAGRMEFLCAHEAVEEMCVDCGAPGADWASIFCSVYICVDCAGVHRGLGVHLSFVRSTRMDKWSPEQLQRMRLGGNSRFQDFLEGYPELRGLAPTPAAQRARYSSCAVAFYQRRLDAECSGSSFIEQPPPADQGHLPRETDAGLRFIGGSRGNSTTSCHGQNQEGGESVGNRVEAGDRRGSDTASETAVSLQEERALLEAAYLEHQRRLCDALAPAGL